MADISKLVANTINLQGYGSSRWFVGYFEKSGKYRKGLAEAAARFFLDYFGRSLDDIALVSSMSVDAKEIEAPNFMEKGDLRLLRTLVQTGLIREINYHARFGCDYSSKEYEAQLKAEWSNFEVFFADAFDLSSLENVLVAKMRVDGVYGHCFLVLERLGLAFYPHDDMGFGVIGLRGSADFHAAKEFLIQAGHLKDHRCVIQM
ncbi:hypothetical protein [Ensifer adhaerens]|uniref:hypothetical protein n=1 Tax=Ensifer adhaerens TaxID=106592 RepID=UPI00098FE231|nr:hypothetical protein [Ensifer adhaerens]